jgi:hypothetical protein
MLLLQYRNRSSYLSQSLFHQLFAAQLLPKIASIRAEFDRIRPLMGKGRAPEVEIVTR